MVRFNVELDQHDVIGILVILLSYGSLAFKWIDGSTLILCLGVAGGFILGSNTALLSGKVSNEISKV